MKEKGFVSEGISRALEITPKRIAKAVSNMSHEILSSAATMFIAGGAILAVTLIVAIKRKK
ncbi:hypothetical protein Q6301_20110 [Klebsiella quasipneumoniae]|uniref:hypothetical protein n=1 Tax=Klebsiella quasipneumoniae TaxID=1463165 RepID=UPI00272FDE90|nr:hypothetical protein [Klebsiella quasipneumoniae]MDP1297881.1 hypothetical protein [Klebsiella quasipneumoniae]